MARYERIVALKGIPFCQTILDYTMAFNGRDIYVSDKTYLSLLELLGFKYDLVGDAVKDIVTETRIYRSRRVPEYVAYAIKR
jgi:hypothetical protein|nr:MAG TPA_asm: hypothetical protein [Caudoviricetes sp.]